MAIDKISRLYDGEALSGANDQVLFVPVEFDLTIQEIKVKLEETASADVVFCLVNADGAVIAGTTQTIAAGSDKHALTGLTIARLEDADIYLKLVSGAVNSTITLTLTVDDGEAGGGLTQADADARYAQSSSVATALAAKQNTLSFTPENAANKNVAGGYVGLDGTTKISSVYLPSYVDDVLEYANFAAFPATGETGKIYIALDTNLEYRWSGSTYIQLVSSPGSTDAVAEGSTNKYFTNARVLAVTLLGYVVGSNAAIAATDTILQAFGKVQAQINALISSVTANTNNISTNSGAITTLQGKAIPAGGTIEQILSKIDGADYNTHWVDKPAGSAGTASADVQILTASGTWTKPAGAKTVEVFLIGGGGGGGSGRKGAAATVRGGGAGGGGGSMAFASFLASVLGATETVTIGAGGAGGVAVTANSSNGNLGTVGGSTSFGGWLLALGGTVGTVGTNSSNVGGVARGGFPSSAATDGGAGGGALTNTAGNAAVATALPPSGGGSGGTVATSNVALAGGAGGAVGITTASGRNSILAGGAINTNGNDSINYAMSGGSGGGGGSSSNTGNANAGGNGGLYGAGGGGGGGSTDSVGNSGAGGAGGAGCAVIISYF